MSKRQKRHQWLKERLLQRGEVSPNDQQLIEEFTELFPEALPSVTLYFYGTTPCKMLRKDCRDLHRKGEFGTRRTIAHSDLSRAQNLGTYSVVYTFYYCYHCAASLEGYTQTYQFGVLQLCYDCYQKMLTEN